MGNKKDGKRRFPVQYLSALARQVLASEVKFRKKEQMPHLYLLSTLHSVDNEQDSVIRALEELLKSKAFCKSEIKSLLQEIIRD